MQKRALGLFSVPQFEQITAETSITEPAPCLTGVDPA